MENNNIDSIKIEIIVTHIGYQVDYYRGDQHSMKARDFGISKKPEKIGDLLANTNLNILDFLQGDINREVER